MCGLFGMVRQPTASPRSAVALMQIGLLAVERGFDSAGMTFVDANGTATTISGPGTFGKVFEHFDRAVFDGARAVVGHTRWATQGNTKSPANISPMPVQHLIATHNGDVEIASIPGIDTLPRPVGGTDTERLFQAIAAEASLEGTAKMLSLVKGRAALAWIDTNVADTIFLARAGLSPLAVATDVEGNLYWASNPDWFRQVDRKFDGAIGFTDITLVNEGTIAVVNTATVTVDHIERFTPTCRPKDVRLTDLAVHRGFTTEDKRNDRAQFCHTVAAEPTRIITGSTNPYSFGSGSYLATDNWDQDTTQVDADGNWWNDDSADDILSIESEAENEAMDIVLDWADQGRPMGPYEELLAAETLKDRWDYCERYDISSGMVLGPLRVLMGQWLGIDGATPQRP